MNAVAPINAVARRWPEEGETKIPYWVYTDKGIYQSELERIWYGEHWLYAGLEAEIPTVGSYRTNTLGERSVIVVRSAENEISVLENRCAHRGVEICQARSGKLDNITCPYHQWSYALDGALQGVPFRRGIKGKGGMGPDFNAGELGLRRLKVEVVNGVIWASFSENTPPFREYFSERLWHSYERMFSGRKLRVEGYTRQIIPANWKLVVENFRDPYHAGLLHVFLPTFGLFRPDQGLEQRMDEKGRHSSIMPIEGHDPRAHSGTEFLSETAHNQTFKLADPRVVEAVHELKGDETVSTATVFPSVVFLQQINSLHVRQIIPRGPDAFEFIFTFFGFEDDDEEMRKRRIRHGNLFGPGGMVTVDDFEVLPMAQSAYRAAENEEAVLFMGQGGREVREDSLATEGAIRGLYQYYREVMGL
jgi:salicylate 5-hydroxylase large subunit